MPTNDTGQKATKRKPKTSDWGAVQLHAGNKTNGAKGPMGKLWHTNSEGKYWSGSWHYRTPLELKRECESTLRDLKKNHPEIF